MAIALDDFDTPLAGDDNGVRRRTPGDFMRDGGGTPWVTNPDGAVVKSGPRKGLPKLEKYGRPSSLGKDIENTYNLDRWNERQIVHGIAKTIAFPDGDDDEAWVDAMVALSDREFDDCKSELDAIVVNAKARAKANLAAERGTHTHLLAELDDTDRDPIAAMENGEALGIPIEAQKAMLEAWRLLCLQHNLEILATEQTVVHDEWRQAGTLDRIVRLGSDLTFANGVTITAGTVLLCDIKTGKLRTSPNGATINYWHSYAVQCCVYAESKPYHCGVGDGDDRRGEWDYLMTARWAVIAHIPVEDALNGAATARLVLVDIDAAREVIEDVIMRAREWQARKDLFAFTMDPPVTVLTVARANRNINDRPVPDEGPYIKPAQRDELKGRVNELKAVHPAAYGVLTGLVKEANNAGRQFALNEPTVRRWHIYRSLLRLAAHFGNDLHEDHLRATVALVVPEVNTPGVFLGPAIGALTIDEAQQLVEATLRVLAEDPALTFDNTGRPTWAHVNPAV